MTTNLLQLEKATGAWLFALGFGALVVFTLIASITSPLLAAGCVFGVPSLIYIVRELYLKPDTGALLIFSPIFLIPFVSISHIRQINPISILSVFSLMFFLLRATNPGWKVPKYIFPAMSGLIIYLISIKISLLINAFYGIPDLFGVHIKHFIGISTMMLLIVSWKSFQKLMDYLMLLMMINAAFGLLQHFLGPDFYIQPYLGYSNFELEFLSSIEKGQGSRAIGLEASSVWFSRTMLFAFTLAFARFVSEQKNKLFWGICSIIFGFTLTLPEIRSSTLAGGLSAVIILLVFMWKRGTLRKYLPILVISSGVIMGTIIFMLLEVGSTDDKVDLNMSVATRVFITSSLLKMYESHYLFGIGYGLPGYSLRDYGFFPNWIYDITVGWKEIRGTHNILLDHLAGGGPLMLGLFLGMVYVTIKNYLTAFFRAMTKRQESILLGLGAFVLPFVFTSIFHNYIYDFLYFFLFCFSFFAKSVFEKKIGADQ